MVFRRTGVQQKILGLEQNLGEVAGQPDARLGEFPRRKRGISYGIGPINIASMFTNTASQGTHIAPRVHRTRKKVSRSFKKAIATMASINTATLSIDDVYCTQRGFSIGRIRDGDGECVLMPTALLCAPFEAGTFDKDPEATRLNLQLCIDPEVEEQLRKFDTWVVDYLVGHSERIFKRATTKEQVQAGYKSCIREPSKDGLALLLKTKIDTSGRYAVVCWDQDGEQAPLPESWSGLRIQSRLRFSHLWKTGTQFGVCVRLTDAKLMQEAPSGPRLNLF